MYGYDLICENNFSLDHRKNFSLLIFTSVGNHILNVVSQIDVLGRDDIPIIFFKELGLEDTVSSYFFSERVG